MASEWQKRQLMPAVVTMTMMPLTYNITNGIGTTLTWDGKDTSGAVVPSGAYIYRIMGEGKVFTGTVAVART